MFVSYEEPLYTIPELGLPDELKPGLDASLLESQVREGLDLANDANQAHTNFADARENHTVLMRPDHYPESSIREATAAVLGSRDKSMEPVPFIGRTQDSATQEARWIMGNYVRARRERYEELVTAAGALIGREAVGVTREDIYATQAMTPQQAAARHARDADVAAQKAAIYRAQQVAHDNRYGNGARDD